MDDYPVDFIRLGTEEYVYTTHVTHQQLFYVHVESRSKILDDIMSKLESRYADIQAGEKPLVNKRIGSLCAAKFTDDGNWYRAKITGLLKNGHVEVQFVDFGNTDYVTEERIKALDPDIVKYPVQSYKCCLADVCCTQGFWTPELIIQFEDRVIDKRCKAVFVREHGEEEMYVLQMFDSQGDSINALFGADSAGVSQADCQAVQNGNSHERGFQETSWDVGAVFQAAVVYVSSPGLFWCQNIQFASDILILSEELSRLHMVQEMRPLVDVSRGTVCAAKFSEDEAWYRGLVHSVSGNQAKVYFVDYGNTETVSMDVICSLKAEMRTLPALGIKCRLHHVESKGREWKPEVTEAFEELVMEKEFEVKVVGKEGDVYIVTLFDVIDNKDVGTQLQSIVQSMNLEATSPDINDNKQPPSSAHSGIGPSLNVGSQVDVYLSWIEHPGDFWVQLSSAEQLLEKLSQELQDVYSQPQPPAHPVAGAFVVARFSLDRMWYRSLVLKAIDDRHVRVLFIDYGNSDTVPVSDLRQVVAAFGQVIPLASRCCLAGVKPLQKGDKLWVADAKSLLEKLTEHGCQCEILSETASHKIVTLTVDGRDISKELLDKGVVSKSTEEARSVTCLGLPEYSLKKSVTEVVNVIHIDSPQNFSCHVTRNIPMLQDLMKQMSHHYASADHRQLSEPALGQVCVVFSNKDKTWYRAEITDISPSSCGVCLLDYGSTEVVPWCHVVVPQPQFLRLPAQAVQCSLALGTDARSLTDTFSNAVLNKELDLLVLDVCGDRAIVELFDGRMKVSELLKGVRHASQEVVLPPAKKISAGSTVKAFTSFVVSPNKFFIQMAGIEGELQDLMDSIALVYNCDDPPPVVTCPRTGQLCIALYSEDDSWYRAQIVAVQGNACVVFFVDFGNEDTVKNENIRVMTSELAQTPAMAYRCSIHGVPDTEWSDEALQRFEALVGEKELTCTFVTSSSVRVLVGAQDVASQLLLQAGHVAETSAPGHQIVSQDRESGSGSRPSSTDYGRTGDKGDSHDDVWDDDRGVSAEGKPDHSHAVGRQGDRTLKYTDIRREHDGFGDARTGPAAGGSHGWDSRFESVDKHNCSHDDGRDSGDRRGRESRFKDSDRNGLRSTDGRGADRNGLRASDGRGGESKSGRDSRFEGSYRRDAESNGIRVGGQGGMSERFKGGRREEFGSGDRRDSDSSSGGRSDRNSRFGVMRGRDAELGENRGQGNARFGGDNANRRLTSGEQLAVSAGDLVYPDIPSHPEQALLVHMDEDGTFYLQLPSMEKDILFLSKRLAGSYKGGSGPRLKETPALGTVCCAKFADDGYMYRAKVEDVQGNRAILRFVDYGNTGECSLSNLKFLFPDLLKYPIQSFPCKLRGYIWSLDEAEKFAKATLDKDLTVTFISNTCPFEVDIMTPAGDLLKILTGEPAPPAQKLSPHGSRGFGHQSQSAGGFGSQAACSESGFQEVKKEHDMKVSNVSSQILPKQLYLPQSPPQDASEAFISHIAHDGYFYVQLAADTATLDSIADKLLTLPEELKHPDLCQGASCAAVFSEDLAWYRARIVQVLGDSLSVVFVDYGNKDCVNSRSIKPLSPELLSHPPLAYQSQFSGLGALSPEAQVKLAEYMTDHQLTVTFSGTTAPFKVTVYTQEGDNLEDIICPPRTYRHPVVPAEVIPVGVTHIEDDGRFFIQLYKHYPALKEFQTTLNSVCKEEAVGGIESPKTDMPCCVQVEAGVWQRGKVIRAVGEAVHVLLVDSGRTTAVDASSLQSLPAQFLKQPPYALECRLKGVEKWTRELREKFSDMTQDKILNATFYSQTFPIRVSLARSIELDLLGLCAPPPDSPVKSPATPAAPQAAAQPPPTTPAAPQAAAAQLPPPTPAAPQAAAAQPPSTPVLAGSQTAPEMKEQAESVEVRSACISHVDVHGGFYIQTVDRDEDLNQLAVRLDAVPCDGCYLDDVAAGDVVCAQFTEDDAWYRAQVESCTDDRQFLIRFIDYGNSDVVGSDRLKALPEELGTANIPPVAVRCRLFGVVSDLTPEQAFKFQKMVADQTVTVVFRSLEDDVQEVEVSLNGQLVTQSLGLETLLELPGCNTKPEVGDDHVHEYVEAVDKEEDCAVGRAADGGILESKDLVNVLEKSSPSGHVDVVDVTSELLVQASACDSVQSTEQTIDAMSVPGLESPNKSLKVSAISNDPGLLNVSLAEVARVVCAGERVEVTVCYVDSPDQFYMQLYSNKTGLDEIMAAIAEQVSGQSGSVEAVRPGDVWAALFEDSSWYRVRVDSVADNGTCQIFYMDYGNTDTVDAASLRQLPEGLKSISAFALRARLAGVCPVGATWTPGAVEEFKKMVEGRHVLADVLHVSEDGAECSTQLLYLGIPVHDELIKKGHGVAVQDGAVSKYVQHFYSDGDSYGTATHTDESSACLESTHLETKDRSLAQQTLGCVSSSLHELVETQVRVSDASNPCSQFWCQLSSSTDTLSDISSQLTAIYGAFCAEYSITEPLHVGDAVVTMSADDGQLYRAQVLNSSLGGVGEGGELPEVRIRFLDYGNESQVPQNQVFRFHKSLYQWPSQAFCCRLDKVQPIDGIWSLEASQKLREILTDQELVVKVVGREHGNGATLLIDAVQQTTGQSVSSLMLEAGLAWVAPSFETCKVQDISEIELDTDLTQPILESTAMLGDNSQARAAVFTFETGDEMFRSVKLSLHTEYDVIVSNDELPSSFHIQLLELQGQYLSLMSEIADHVVSNSGLKAEFLPEPGEACLVQHLGTWYRGLVVARQPDLWNVKSIDCGWMVSVSCQDLMTLPRHLRELPAQALPCYLAGIVSVDTEWATDGVVFFMDCVREAKMCIYVLECAEDGKYGVYLSDLDSTGSHSINTAMVDLGYAEVVPGSNIEVQIEMEKTLDTDMLQDLEESFNEISQLKSNTDCCWDGEAVSSIAFDSENPLRQPEGIIEDSDVYRAATMDIDKTVYHLIQMPPSLASTASMESTHESASRDVMPSGGTNLVIQEECCPLKHAVSPFDCAWAVERIDQMGCLDNFPDDLFAGYEESLEETSVEHRQVPGVEDGHSNSHLCRPYPGGDKQANDVAKSQSQESQPEAAESRVVTELAGTDLKATYMAASTDRPADHKTDINNTNQAFCAYGVAPGHHTRTWVTGKSVATADICQLSTEATADIRELSTESIEVMIEISGSSEESLNVVVLDVSRGQTEIEIIPSEDHAQTGQLVGQAGQQTTDRLQPVSGDSLVEECRWVKLGLGQAIPNGLDQITVPAGAVRCEGGEVTTWELAGNHMAYFATTSFSRSSSASSDSSTDNYQSCGEVLSQESSDWQAGEDSHDSSGSWSGSFKELDDDTDDTNYDTSSLVFSDSCVDSSMDVSGLCGTHSREISGLDRSVMSDSCHDSNTSADTHNSSSSDNTVSSRHPVSTVVTSASDDTCWVHQVSSSADSSYAQTDTNLPAVGSEHGTSEPDRDSLDKRVSVCGQKGQVVVLSSAGDVIPGDIHSPEELQPHTVGGSVWEGEPGIVVDMMEHGGTQLQHQNTLATDGLTDTVHGQETSHHGTLPTPDLHIPDTVLDNPASVSDNPASVSDNPATVSDNPATVLDNPATVTDILQMVHPICTGDLPKKDMKMTSNRQESVLFAISNKRETEIVPTNTVTILNRREFYTRETSNRQIDGRETSNRQIDGRETFYIGANNKTASNKRETNTNATFNRNMDTIEMCHTSKADNHWPAKTGAETHRLWPGKELTTPDGQHISASGEPGDTSQNDLLSLHLQQTGSPCLLERPVSVTDSSSSAVTSSSCSSNDIAGTHPVPCSTTDCHYQVVRSPSGLESECECCTSGTVSTSSAVTGSMCDTCSLAEASVSHCVHGAVTDIDDCPEMNLTESLSGKHTSRVNILETGHSTPGMHVVPEAVHSTQRMHVVPEAVHSTQGKHVVPEAVHSRENSTSSLVSPETVVIKEGQESSLCTDIPKATLHVPEIVMTNTGRKLCTGTKGHHQKFPSGIQVSEHLEALVSFNVAVRPVLLPASHGVESDPCTDNQLKARGSGPDTKQLDSSCRFPSFITIIEGASVVDKCTEFVVTQGDKIGQDEIHPGDEILPGDEIHPGDMCQGHEMVQGDEILPGDEICPGDVCQEHEMVQRDKMGQEDEICQKLEMIQGDEIYPGDKMVKDDEIIVDSQWLPTPRASAVCVEDCVGGGETATITVCGSQRENPVSPGGSVSMLAGASVIFEDSLSAASCGCEWLEPQVSVNSLTIKLSLDSVNSPRAKSSLDFVNSPGAKSSLDSVNSPRAKSSLDFVNSPRAKSSLDSVNSPRAKSSLDFVNSPRAKSSLDSVNSPRARCSLDSASCGHGPVSGSVCVSDMLENEALLGACPGAVASHEVISFDQGHNSAGFALYRAESDPQLPAISPQPQEHMNTAEPGDSQTGGVQLVGAAGDTGACLT